jgi:hypothetical protein
MSARTVAAQWLLRSSALVLWTLVLWGALLAFLTLLDVAGEGLGPALGRLLPSRGASVWAWVNTLSVALAMAVGLVAGGLFVWGRGRRRAWSSEQPGD